MLTTRVVPDGGRGVGRWRRRGRTSCRWPSRCIGVVPQTNTLDRSLSVWENLYFHGRFFGMSARDGKGRGDAAARAVLARRSRGRAGARAVGRDGAAADGGAGGHAPARRSCSSTSPPPASIPRAASRCGRSSHELHADGQTILLTTHYMEEADQLCDRVAVIDHGRILALDTPGASEEQRRRRHDRHGLGRRSTSTQLADLLEREIPGVTHVELVDGTVRLGVKGSRACCPPSSRRRAGRVHRHRPVAGRADARDRLHQPHREGAARLMATVTDIARRRDAIDSPPRNAAR